MELLERDHILDELHRLLRRAGEGHGSLLLLGGEAGIGKTAIVRRFCEEARRSAQVLLGNCDAISTPRALGPLYDLAVPRLTRLLNEDAPRDLLFRTVLGIFGETSRATVLAIEDAHWADDATLDLWRFLGRRVESTRALVIVTYRDDEIGPRHRLRGLLGDLATASAVQRVTLAPLSFETVRTLALERNVDPTVLYDRTRGNPFFVTEILETGIEIPPTVRDAVLARAARLSAGAWDLLKAAAVVGPQSDVDVLDQVAQPIVRDLDACLESGVLWSSSQTIAFRHELAREAILEEIAPTSQTALHRKALRVLAAHPIHGADPALLAHHAEGARDREAVLLHAPAAGRRASLLRAHREAADQYARALRFAGDAPPAERALLLEARSHECYLTAQIDEAIAAREAALAIWQQLGNRRNEGENRCHLAILHWAAARPEEAKREATAAVSILELLAPGPELAVAYRTLARLHGTILDDAEAIAWGERAIALAERFNAIETLVDALITVGVARLARGNFAEGHAQLERSIELATASGLDDLAARAYANLGFGYDEHYRFDLAARHYRRGIQFCFEHDLDHSRQHMTAWLARCQFFLGHWSEASDLASSVLAARDSAPVTQFVGLLVAGMVSMRRGEPGAGPLLDEALALAAASGSLYRLGPVHAARAEAAFQFGDRARAVVEASAVFDLALAQEQRWYAGELAYWRWKGGGLTQEPASIAEPFARQMAGDWAGAAALWDELGCTFEAARARAESDEEAALRTALAAFEGLGARPAASAVRRRLRALGARGVPRGPRAATRANPAGLTARELDILSLVAEGHGNQAIADLLFLSPRTVENHVAMILSKLNAATRSDAVSVAQLAGIIPQSE